MIRMNSGFRRNDGGGDAGRLAVAANQCRHWLPGSACALGTPGRARHAVPLR